VKEVVIGLRVCPAAQLPQRRSPDERADVMGENARRFYRLD